MAQQAHYRLIDNHRTTPLLHSAIGPRLLLTFAPPFHIGDMTGKDIQHHLSEKILNLKAEIDAIAPDSEGSVSRLAELANRLNQTCAILAHEMSRPEPEISHESTIENKPESDVSPRQINILDAIEELSSDPQPTPEPILEPQPEPEPLPESEPAKEPEEFEAPASEPQPVLNPQPVFEAAPPPVIQPAQEPTSMQAPKPTPAASSASSINERLAAERAKKSLADKLALTPLPDIKKAISLNLKFQFINELFGGDAMAFENAISRLNTALDGIAAMDILEKDLCPKQGWDEESKIYLDLRTLVERRYL